MIDEIKPDYPDTKLEDQAKAEKVFGLFKTVSVVPTVVPTNWFNQILIYKSGATLRLYWYDTTNAAWHYVTATA